MRLIGGFDPRCPACWLAAVIMLVPVVLFVAIMIVLTRWLVALIG